ncbi:MAG: hypothetical protein A2Y12_06765 [Planctomycetes bacterium GWF2_42_9]|nr:MAG: hypothetical protein A2Y12_06765 [Planctomycetes bacterium GWF2_42_9]
MNIWIADSLARILPETKPASTKSIKLCGNRNQVISFQVGFRPRVDPTPNQQPNKVSFSGNLSKYCSVRLCQLVPLKNQSTGTPLSLTEGTVPGFVPDPLIEEFHDKQFSSGQSRSYWITVRLPNRAMKGKVSVSIEIDKDKTYTVDATINVLPFTLPPLQLPITHWFYSDAIADWYGVEPFSAAYWQLVHKYLKNMADHNQTAIYTPLFTPPTDGEKKTMQLVDVHETDSGQYTFGWSKLRKWIALAKKCGFTYFEMSHLFSQWGAKYAIKIIVDRNGRKKLFCPLDAPATGSVYHNFLQQFLPELVKFLKKERVFKNSIFHCSDEPEMSHLEQYSKVRQMIRQISPEIKISETLSNYDFFSQGHVDNPIPNIMTVSNFISKDVKTWVYYCCVPRFEFPNRFLDYPLFRLRILGLQLFRFQLKGFLHWGCNYWYKHGTTELIDPYLDNDGLNWPSWFAGDTFVLYPGKNGPVDSIRWEVYRELLDDYRLLCLASRIAGQQKIMSLLKDIKAPDKFPQNADYIRRIRAKIIDIICKHK